MVWTCENFIAEIQSFGDFACHISGTLRFLTKINKVALHSACTCTFLLKTDLNKIGIHLYRCWHGSVNQLKIVCKIGKYFGTLKIYTTSLRYTWRLTFLCAYNNITYRQILHFWSPKILLSFYREDSYVVRA